MRTREEQIDSLYHGHYQYSALSQDAFRKHLIEAERRAEQRVRAEIGRDSERLDWISSTLTEMRLIVATRRRFVSTVTLSGPVPASHLRMSMDAAREVG